MNENCEPVQLRLVLPGIKIPVVGEISRQDAPNFDFRGQKGLHVCWGMYKRQKRTERAPERVLWLVRMLVDVWRPYSFGHDQRQIFRLKEYLDGSVEA